MKVKEFNEAYDTKFRFVPRETMRGMRQDLQQYCPLARRYVTMLLPGYKSFRMDPKADPDEVIIPSDILRVVENPGKWVIIRIEKYGTWYYDASDTEAIGLASLEILKQRFDDDYYVNPGGEPPESPKHRPEEFADDKELERAVRQQWDNYERRSSMWERETHEYSEAVRILETLDYHGAYHFLQKRKYHEYEGFAIESLTNVEEAKEAVLAKA